MKVYVISIGEDYEDEFVYGIYADIEKAKEKVKEIIGSEFYKYKYSKHKYRTDIFHYWSRGYQYVEIVPYDVIGG